MNCRPGDLAVTHGAPMDNGLIVEVIERPSDSYKVPDYMGACWLVRSKGSYFHIERNRQSEIAIWPDKLLRPIRPGDISDEEVRDLYAPKQPELA